MKVGDLVKIVRNTMYGPCDPVQAAWTGVIIGWDGGEPIVMWNEKFHAEVEYREQLEVVSESR